MVIQPGMYIGYTWIKSANYISTLGNNIENQNFNVFEVNPEISILKYIGAGWTGSINFKYRFIMWQDGTLTVNNNIMDDLYTRDYAEYGIGIEKNIDKFYISMNINRVDGGRYGWNGGLRLKYIF